MFKSACSRSGWLYALCAGALLTAVAGSTAQQVPTEPWQAPDFKPARDVAELARLDSVPTRAMPLLDYEAIEDEDFKREMDGLPPRFAIPHPVKIDVTEAGTWELIDGGLAVLRYRVTCTNAESINFGFSRFLMPEDGRMFVYAADNSTKMRPFTWLDNEDHGELWTPPVESHDVVIEVTVPTRRIRQLELELGSINLGYLKFGDMVSRSGSCNVDVVCPEGDPWQMEIKSVAVISTGGSTFCTGAMINNVANDRTPFFLTADHCGINSTNAPSLVTFWNYENSTCRAPGSGASGGSGDGTLDEFNTGSTWLASLSASDFTLVVMDDMPDPDFDVHYAGWDARPQDANWAVAIHHPSTDEKRISFENDPVESTNGFTSGPPIDPTNPDANHVLVNDWDLGTTEPGSSGSPLFDGDTHRVIGQLHGGGAACGNDSFDSYGKFAYSFDRPGATSTNSLKPHLDPGNTGTLFVDTIGNGIAVSPTSNVTHQGPTGGPFTNNPTQYTLTNNGGASAGYEISLGAGTAPITIDGGTGPVSGTLAASGGSVMVDVAVGVSAAGVYTRDVLFTDTTAGVTTTVSHVLEIGQVGFSTTPAEGFVSGGPVGGPFTGTKIYTVTNTQPNPIDVEVSADVAWIEVGSPARGGSHIVSLGGLGDSEDVMISFNSNANLLSEGENSGTVSFTGLSGDGSDDTTRPVVLDVGRFTYAASGLPEPIPDSGSGSLTNTITVPDTYCVGDLIVEIAIDHTYIGDLRVELSHDGTTVAMIDRPGYTGSGFGCEQDNFNIVLDDEGLGGAIEDQCTANLASPPSYTPNESLGLFDGLDVNGDWTLTVTDNAGQDTGSLIAWSLKVLADPECLPIADPLAIEVPLNTATEIQLSGTSPVGNPLDYIITSLPSHGVLSEPTRGAINSVPHMLAGDSVIYTPDTDYNGADNFQYEVNDGAPSDPADVDLAVGGAEVIYEWLLDSDPGWDTTGDWEFGVPLGNSDDPSSGFTGSNVYGYNLAGEYPNNLPEETLTTGAIDCSNITGTTLSFYRQLGVENNAWDHAYVRISTDGTTWATIWANGPTILEESVWSEHEYDISLLADGQETVYIRWVMGTTDGSVTFAGWNIDDIRISGFATPSQPGDIDGDGDVDLADLLAVLSGWGSPYDLSDLLTVLSNWGAGV